MPNVSRETASESIALDGLEVHLENLEGGYTVCFESHTADVDLAPLFRGLPDDRCQFPRWGYVVEGLVEFRFADHTERYKAGDAYYVFYKVSYRLGFHPWEDLAAHPPFADQLLSLVAREEYGLEPPY
jgi:hypothetical protein